MTPARIASLAVVLVLTLVLTPLRADDGSFVGALLVALIGAMVLVAGASLNPFQMRHGTLFGPDAHVIRVDNEACTTSAWTSTSTRTWAPS